MFRHDRARSGRVRPHADADPGRADGDEWVINGHKWFISGARGAQFAILLARTETTPRCRRRPRRLHRRRAHRRVELVRDIETMSGSHNHCEIRITDLRVADSQMLGGRGQGHRLGQKRLGPARLAHCMRWLGQIEMALDMMVERSIERYSHGSYLSEKQGIQWMISESAIELYQAKLMVLHAAYLLENDLPFSTEVSMAKHHVANTLWRVIDRAVQVHGALGYSKDSPLADMLVQARWSRFADGPTRSTSWRVAEAVIQSRTGARAGPGRNPCLCSSLRRPVPLARDRLKRVGVTVEAGPPAGASLLAADMLVETPWPGGPKAGPIGVGIRRPRACPGESGVIRQGQICSPLRPRSLNGRQSQHR